MGHEKFFDHYRLLHDGDGDPVELGRGGNAVTYAAEDINLERRVALKVIDAESLDEETCAKFKSEARSAALLKQRNVAAVHHLGADKGHFFYAMEYLEGETVEGWVKKHGPMRPIDALKIGLQVAKALVAASRHGLTHGDIKPANLILCGSDDGEWPIAKVIDFGLVTATKKMAGSVPNPAGFNGTAQYASPEQAQERAIDSRSDVYSLGCTLWFLLSGEPPFSGSLASIFAQHLKAPVPLHKLAATPRCIRKLLQQMLAKNAADRPYPKELTRKIRSCIFSVRRQQSLARFLLPSGGMLRDKWVAIPGRFKPVLATAIVLLVGGLIAFGIRERPVDLSGSEKPAAAVMEAPSPLGASGPASQPGNETENDLMQSPDSAPSPITPDQSVQSASATSKVAQRNAKPSSRPKSSRATASRRSTRPGFVSKARRVLGLRQ